MAIVIVGTDDKHIKRCTCGHCASILEYTLADTVKEIVKDYGGGSDTYRFLTCPKCQSTVKVPL